MISERGKVECPTAEGPTPPAWGVASQPTMWLFTTLHVIWLQIILNLLTREKVVDLSST